MAQSATLTERIRKILARRKGVREKRMFGVDFLLHGNLLVGVWKNWIERASKFVRTLPAKENKA